MSFSIGNAVSEGLKNLGNKATLTIWMALTFVYLIQDFGTDTLTASGGQAEIAPLALGSSGALGGLILLVSAALAVVLALTALRFYSSDSSQLQSSMFQENLLIPAANLVVGSIAFSFVVGIGFLLLIVPGLFLLTALYFYTFRIAVESENFVEALRSSYSLTAGNRLELFGLGVLVTIPILIATSIASPLLIFASTATMQAALVSMIVFNAILALLFVAGISIAGQAYNQLVELQG